MLRNPPERKARNRYAPFFLKLLTLENLVTEFIKRNTETESFLDVIRNKYKTADDAVPLFIESFKKHGFNPATGIEFVNILQLLRDKNAINTFELNDISKLFDSLLNLQDYNLETYVEAANFEWRVMDNHEKAKEIIKTGLQKASEKVNELENLSLTISKA